MKKEETKIPIAWDLISKAPNSGYSERESCIDWDDINDIMIKFAKLHVQAAIKECIESAPSGSSTDTVSYKDVVEALTDCYPLTNIK